MSETDDEVFKLLIVNLMMSGGSGLLLPLRSLRWLRHHFLQLVDTQRRALIHSLRTYGAAINLLLQGTFYARRGEVCEAH